MRRRKLQAILLTMSLSLTLVVPTGCMKSSASSAKGGNIKFMLWDDPETSEDLISKGFKQTVDRFNKDYEGKYHCEIVPSSVDQHQAKVNAAIASGKCPDLFIMNVGGKFSYYVRENVAADLTDAVTGDKEWYGKFIEGMFDNVSYNDKNNNIPFTDGKGNINKGAKIKGMPVNFACACTLYNKELFKKVGIKEPPKTYDEFIQDCEKFKKAGITPITISAATSWCLAMLSGYLSIREGGPDNIAGIRAGTKDWKDPSYVNSFKKMLELRKYFQKKYVTDENEEATANFYNGKAAMMVQGSWVLAQINGSSEGFKDKYGVFQFPDIKGGTGNGRVQAKTDNIIMSASTKEKDACIALLKYFTDDESQRYTAEVGGKIPVTNVEYDKDKAPKQLIEIMDMLKNSKGQDMFYSEALLTADAGSKYKEVVVSMCQGKKSVDKALDELNAYFKENIWGKELKGY